jgi:demethylspheroidene O-methyltransferase
MSPHEPVARDTLSDRWFRARNWLLTHPRFHRWAVRLPIFRWVARRRTAALFDLCAGFVYSQVLFAAVRLQLFTFLAEGPQTALQLAPRLGLRLEAAQRLLDAAAALKLAERRSQARYGLGIHGASLVATPAVVQMVLHHGMFYRDLVDPVGLLSRETSDTELRRFWSYSGRATEHSTPSQVAEYSELMAGSMSLIADDILDAYPLKRHQHLLDLGGGAGAFVEAVARATPLKLTLFDLPPVAERARSRLAALGLGDRVEVCGGDLFTTPLPAGADVVSLVRVVHDHDDAQALKILQAARAALGPRGVLLIAEPMSGTPGAEAMGDAYFGFYLYSMGQGRPRTSRALLALVAEAGFARARVAPTRRPMLTQLIVAQVT